MIWTLGKGFVFAPPPTDTATLGCGLSVEVLNPNLQTAMWVWSSSARRTRSSPRLLSRSRKHQRTARASSATLNLGLRGEGSAVAYAEGVKMTSVYTELCASGPLAHRPWQFRAKAGAEQRELGHAPGVLDEPSTSRPRPSAGRSCGRHAVLGAVAWLLASQPSYGFDSSQLRYVRGEGAELCPEEAALRAEVQHRLGYDPFVPSSDRTISVTIWREADQLAGRVELVDAQGTSKGLRVVSTDPTRCNDLISTLALSISIAIDQASVEQPAAAEPAQPAATGEAAQPPQPVVTRVEPPPPAAVRREVARKAVSSNSWAIGAGIFGSSWINPGLTAGASATVSRRLGATSLSLGVRADLPVRSRPWEFRSHTLLLDSVACVHSGPYFGCPMASPGVFFASDAKRGSAFFLLAGARLGGQLPLSEHASLQGHADVLFPAVRPQVIARSGEVWEANILSASLGAAVLWHFF